MNDSLLKSLRGDILNEMLFKRVVHIHYQECGGYYVTFLFPDYFYWPRNPNVAIQIIDFDTHISILSERYEDVDRGASIMVKPGHWIMIVIVFSRFKFTILDEEQMYIIELSQNQKNSLTSH